MCLVEESPICAGAFDEQTLLGLHSGSEPEHDTELGTCSTCLGAIMQPCVLWPCGHVFDIPCVLTWFQTIRDFPDIDNFDEMPSVYRCSICRTVTERICHSFTSEGHLTHTLVFKNKSMTIASESQDTSKAVKFSRAVIRYRAANSRLSECAKDSSPDSPLSIHTVWNEFMAAVKEVLATSRCLNLPPLRPRRRPTYQEAMDSEPHH